MSCEYQITSQTLNTILDTLFQNQHNRNSCKQEWVYISMFKTKVKQNILEQLYRIVVLLNKNRISYRESASPVVNLKLTNINYVALNINQKVVTRWGRWGWDKAFSNLPILGNQSQMCIQTKTRGFWLHTKNMIHTQNRQYPTDVCYDAFSSLRYQNHEL